MVDTRASASEANLRQQVLTTKLAIPPHRSDVVSRSRLTARVAPDFPAKLTLISAPAGFGKTTLVTEWFVGYSAPERVAWVSLDPGDNDPSRFLMYLVEAIRTVEPDFAPGLLNLIHASAGDNPTLALTDLLNGLLQLVDPVVLVLDDYHVIADDSVHQATAFILDHQPQSFHLIITSRVTPPLSLSLMRTRREIAEITIEDLRFTVEEATEFLNEVMGLRLTLEQVRQLDERTEGWIAGLLLAALSSTESSDPEQVLDSFGGEHRYVFDYLAEEVLRRQSDEVQRFLDDTAVLTRMSADLVEMLAGAGQPMLDFLVARNLFTLPLDNDRSWYRYHHLFGEFLSARLRANDAGRWRDQHRRASDWYHGHGLFHDAAEHALEGKDLDRLMKVLEVAGADLVRRGGILTVSRWLSALSDEDITGRPYLMALKATVGTFSWKLDEATAWLDRLDRESDPGDEASLWLQIESASTRASLARFRDDHEMAVAQSLRALALYAQSSQPDHPSSCEPLLHIGAVAEIDGATAKAIETLKTTIERAVGSDHHIVEVNARSHLAAAYRDLGEFSEAEAWARKTCELEQRLGLRRLAMTEAARVSLARILRERQEFDEARALMLDTLATVEATGIARDLWAQFYALYEHALLDVNSGDAALALEAMADARRRADRWLKDPRDRWRVAGLAAHIYVLTGEIERAAAWVGEDDFPRTEPIDFKDERVALVRAQIDVEHERVEEAEALLLRLIPGLEAGGRKYRLAGARLLLALVRQRQGRADESERLFDLAVDFALIQNCQRLLLDTHQDLHRLLHTAQVRAAGRRVVPANVLTEFFDAIGPHLTSDSLSGQPALREPLTPRELEVLALLGEGCSNRDVAEQLFVSVGTVKRHTHNIYSKLCVHNRTQAIARSRQIGILE